MTARSNSVSTGLNRRGVLTGLTVAAGAAMAGGAGTAAAAVAAPIVPVTSLNHINLAVKDAKKSAEFYMSVFGAKPAAGYGNNQTLILPGAKPGYGSWLSLVGATDARPMMDHSTGKPGVYTHFGIGTSVSEREFPRIAMEIEKRFPDMKWSERPTLPLTEQAGREIYIFDPDGLAFQLISTEFNAWGDIGAGSKDPPLAPIMSINHLHIEVSDLKKSVEFYSAVYGGKPAGNAPGLQTRVLPSAKPGFGSWLSLSQGRVDKEGKYDKTDGAPGHVSHVGYGVAVPSKEFPRIASEIKKRFPDLPAPNLPVTEQAGQEIYVFDPDGLPLQLIAVDFNAW